MERSGFRRTKALISLKRHKIGSRLLLHEDQKEVAYAFSIGTKIYDLAAAGLLSRAGLQKPRFSKTFF